MVRSQFGINLKLNVTLKMILRMMLVLSSLVPGSGQKRMIMMTMTRSPITDSGPPANCQTPPPAVGMTLMKFHCAHLIVLENTQADSVSSPVESCVVIGREASC